MQIIYREIIMQNGYHNAVWCTREREKTGTVSTARTTSKLEVTDVYHTTRVVEDFQGELKFRLNLRDPKSS